mgnify:CR=1 FL=1
MHSQMGLAHFWSQGDLITHTTALILGLLSVGSWSVILTKLMTAWRASRSQERALAAFWSANSLPEALEALRRDDASGVSIAVRGPVTIQSAFSIEPVNITSTQITKSVSGEGDGSKRGSDTMGMKHRVDSGIYVAYGAMSPQLAERTGFSDADAEKIKTVLTQLFEGDASSARPEGSMQVLKLIWWEHNCKSGQYSSAKVHGSLKVNADGSYVLSQLDGLTPDAIDGF